MFFADYEQGDTGAGVTSLQKNLVSMGYPITIDGNFGPQTKAAVTHFQNAKDVIDTAPKGTAGPGTLIYMSTAIASGWRQTGFSAPSAVSGGSGTPTGGSSSGPITLPLGLTPLKLGLLAVIGAAAWYSQKK
jgi:peptidoglycan hydrolase-like protein with peptidoglycan-binding domain